MTAAIAAAVLGAGSLWMHARSRSEVPPVAFIPQAAGAMLWDVGYFGASVAAEKTNIHLYWAAPTSEEDIAGQVSLIERVREGKYQGLIVAPNHPFAVLTPLRRAAASQLPVVVISAEIDLPPSRSLGYIVNDEDKMGQLAAAEAARLIGGKGAVAMVGLSQYAPGIKERLRGAERFLRDRYPEIRVVTRVAGGLNASRAEQLTAEALGLHPEVNAVVSFNAAATRGAQAALKSQSLQDTVKLIGCDQDASLMDAIRTGEVAALTAIDTYRMGYEAVGLIAAAREGKPIPPRSVVPPVLITPENLDSTEVSRLIHHRK